MPQRSKRLDRWQQIEWPLTVGMTLISFVLGLLGYWQLLQESSIPAEDWSWTDVLYGTLRLFVLDAGAEEGSASWPVPLQVARLLAPLSLAWAAIRGFLVVARDSLRERRVARQLQKMEGHTVLLGGGSTGAILWHQLVERGDDVVRALCDDRVEVSTAGEYWCPMEGTAGQEALRASRVEAASRVVVASGSDHENMRIVKELADYLEAESASRAREPIACHVEMSADPGSPLKRGEPANNLSNQGLLDVRLFQPDRIAARVLIHQHPPHSRRLPEPDGEPIHVLVQGFDPFGKEVVKQLIRVGHYLDRNRIRITIVAEHAERAWMRFQKEVPALAQVADVVFRDGDPGAITEKEWRDLQSKGAFDAVYTTTMDDDEAFAFAMDASAWLTGAETPPGVVVCGGDAAFLSSQRPSAEQVVAFDPRASAWTVEYMLEDRGEIAAMAIHAEYHSGRRRAADFGQRPADRPWRELSEYLRDNNRDQADHIDVKLAMLRISRADVIERAAGKGGLGGWEILGLKGSDRERMAQVEHRRWWASQALAGYVHGEERDEGRRRHPDMIPYADLSESTRKYDRDVIARLPKTLQVLEAAATDHKKAAKLKVAKKAASSKTATRKALKAAKAWMKTK